MKGINKFMRDINVIYEKISINTPNNVINSIKTLKNKLIELYKRGLVKINHSVMELVVAKQLLLKGYNVDIECNLERNLTCDIYGVKGDGRIIVEVETGFVPPEHALDPTTYIKARIASKIARYSNYAEKFALAFPLFYLPQIPEIYIIPPRYRSESRVNEIKRLCDYYYKKPPVSLDKIKNARLHAIFIVNSDLAIAREIDPETYFEIYKGILKKLYSRNSDLKSSSII